jgi:hypothetical protein
MDRQVLAPVGEGVGLIVVVNLKSDLGVVIR